MEGNLSGPPGRNVINIMGLRDVITEIALWTLRNVINPLVGMILRQ